MNKRIIAMLLALALLLTVLPVNAMLASAAETGCLSILDSAPTTAEVTAGSQLEIDLTTVFQDSDGHSLTYTLGAGDFSEHTKIAGSIFYLSEKDAGTYEAVITATCSDGQSLSHTITVTVNDADHGLDSQYNYDETPADQVTVYFTLSNDGVPLVGADGTILSHLEVTVPYFDLALYGLEQFYRYHTENGEGEYVDDVVVERPTGLHLYLYMLERYFMGLPEEECCKGTSGVLDCFTLGEDVMYMDGTPAYSANLYALYITGSATSLYMSNFWGHDENLMYYRNHVYPYMSPGWGSTSDYIVLSDGDTWDVAMFTNWSFYSSGGAFTCFDKDTYTAQPGSELTFDVLGYGTTYESSNFYPFSYLDVYLYDKDWNELGQIKSCDTDDSSVTFTVPETEGTYYLLGLDPNRQTDEAKYAPATAMLVVSGDAEGERPFESISVNGVKIDETSITYKGTIELGSEDNETFSNVYENVPYYHVIVPEGTETVDIVYSEGVDIYHADSTAYGYETDLEVDAVTSATIRTVTLTDSYTENEDGTQTVTMPVTRYVLNEDGSGMAVTLESSTLNEFAPVALFTFEYGESVEEEDPDPAPDVGDSTVYGDINGDGEIDSTDAALVYRAANGKKDLTDEQKAAADVNGDSVVDSTDAALIYRYANGKLTKFPVENNS